MNDNIEIAKIAAQLTTLAIDNKTNDLIKFLPAGRPPQDIGVLVIFDTIYKHLQSTLKA